MSKSFLSSFPPFSSLSLSLLGIISSTDRHSVTYVDLPLQELQRIIVDYECLTMKFQLVLHRQRFPYVDKLWGPNDWTPGNLERTTDLGSRQVWWCFCLGVEVSVLHHSGCVVLSYYGDGGPRVMSLRTYVLIMTVLRPVHCLFNHVRRHY